MQGSDLTAAALSGTSAIDFSLWGMISQADPVVKIVMLILLLASFWSWSIIFSKFSRLRTLALQASTFEDLFWSGGALDDLYDRIAQKPKNPMESVFCAAMREWRRSLTKGKAATSDLRATIQDRIDRIMNVTVGREIDVLERRMGFLASIGATAVFIGLFGTVWGIMHSFQSIALQKNTNLAVVAPGIAEALLATAFGLVAAIPAVVAYNKLSADINRYGNRLESFSSEFGSIISRQLEESDS
ncbi:MAG: protein TolQ [Alphaproteobacteria bacterium]|jgi:biopolymer transport protein TolQ|nr:protein TolQ [Alphaproteobacteria bacterium]MBT5389219.1 protein TolQ [Alphaproteobacteria bacterium]MBT5540683.1 protein TolQ [Alphaproteobacteria bacterium]MBT5653907.1 protein TolQ [Alphaproteobacteria bacterium]